MNQVWVHILVFVTSLAVVGVTAAAQEAFGHLNAARLRRLMQQGASRSQALSRVVHDPGPFFSSVALLYLLSVSATTVVTFDFVQRVVPDLAIQIVAVGAAGVLVLIAQTLGRSMAALRPEPVAVVLYGPLRVLGALTVPLVRPWDLLTTKLLRRLTGVQGDDRLATTEEDLRLLVDVVEETEALEDEEREMITSIFELSDRDVREIMIPRVDLVAIESSASVSDAIRIVISSGHSRVPVYEGDLDQIVGIVHLRDLAANVQSGREGVPVAELVRPAHVVPETKKIDELLREFQVQRIQMAVVADEYGGTAGLVTIEDLLEEIVGEIHDEYDVPEQSITRTGERELVVNASVSIHDVNEELGLELDDDDYGTLGGLVVARLGKLPVVGDSVLLEQCSIRVLSVTGHRVDSVQVTLQEPV